MAAHFCVLPKEMSGDFLPKLEKKRDAANCSVSVCKLRIAICRARGVCMGEEKKEKTKMEAVVVGFLVVPKIKVDRARSAQMLPFIRQPSPIGVSQLDIKPHQADHETSSSPSSPPSCRVNRLLRPPAVWCPSPRCVAASSAPAPELSMARELRNFPEAERLAPSTASMC